MSLRRTSFEAGASREALRGRAFEEYADGQDFRGRAEELLQKASATDDVAERTELIIKAAILHHLALLRETGGRTAPMELHEAPSFAKSKVEAQILGQDGERRGLRGGPINLQRARDAYDAGGAVAETVPAGLGPHRGGPGLGRKL